MRRPIVQIYEIQTPAEARALIARGVDHIGSVVTACETRRDPLIRETVAQVREMGAVSSLIPLFSDVEAVCDTLAYHRPHIVHFCDRLDGGDEPAMRAAVDLQQTVRRRFPDIRIMRSIPIGRKPVASSRAVLELAGRLEPFSDFFLTDTVLDGPSGGGDADQPVQGFVGITGLTCDWSVAARLVAHSRIPVILAGGISPENVLEGILSVRPFGVDSCTATNAVDGSGRPIRFRKDLARIEALMDQVRLAVERIGEGGRHAGSTGR